jgi:hypothetical protein
LRSLQTLQQILHYRALYAWAHPYAHLAPSLAVIRTHQPAEIASSNPVTDELFARWNEGPLSSYLIEITAKIFTCIDKGTQRPLVEMILNQAEQNGTGRWTIQAALDLGVPILTIGTAVDARILSSGESERMKAAGIFPIPLTLITPMRVIKMFSSGLSGMRSMSRRSAPMPREWHSSAGPEKNTTTIQIVAKSPESGGAGASSAPGFWTMSGRRFKKTRAFPTSCWHLFSGKPFCTGTSLCGRS